jgi:hypothetical protein
MPMTMEPHPKIQAVRFSATDSESTGLRCERGNLRCVVPDNGAAMTLPPPRFTLESLMPQELGLETHAVLYDAEQHPDHVLAMGHGEMRRRRCSTSGRRSRNTRHLPSRSHMSLRHSRTGKAPR